MCLMFAVGLRASRLVSPSNPRSLGAVVYVRAPYGSVCVNVRCGFFCLLFGQVNPSNPRSLGRRGRVCTWLL